MVWFKDLARSDKFCRNSMTGTEFPESGRNRYKVLCSAKQSKRQLSLYLGDVFSADHQSIAAGIHLQTADD